MTALAAGARVARGAPRTRVHVPAGGSRSGGRAARRPCRPVSPRGGPERQGGPAAPGILYHAAVLTTLAQDLETGDLSFNAKGLRLATGADAVVVLATNNLRQRPGEDRLRPERGVMWPELLGRGASATAIRGAIVRSVSTVSGVERVIDCQVTTGKTTVDAKLVLGTAEGPAEASVTLG